jgi:Domain of unknown function (DUF5916)/Carbohydrate family 9 binding domain-like
VNFRRPSLSTAATLLLLSRAAWGQDGGVATALPTTISDADRLSVPAISVAPPPNIDGVLDDPVWTTNTPLTGFIQSEPDEGQPATERTSVWVAYDENNLYVAAHMYDSDPSGIVVSEIRKDFRADNQDTFEVILDTFGDRRNGYHFATNPAGARADEQITNEGRETNTSWDAPWKASAHRTSDGWTAEMVIPFSAVRSVGGDEMSWGINFSRRIRRKNEVVFWAPIPRAYTITRLSLAGNLTDLREVRRGRDIRLTPYLLGRTVRETGGTAFDQDVQAGVDAKFGVTNGLTLDATVNPDFAQVEVDVQQVNLTQFNQFFPEKRDFFLENSGIFYIGDTPRNRRVAQAPQGDEDLLVFFSRRIGLSSDGRPLPISAGVRLTGQEGEFQVGALGAVTREQFGFPGENFGVFRLRRNLFSNSDVGALFMTRLVAGNTSLYNHVYGVDANIRLPAGIDWSSFVLNSEAPGVTGPRYAFQTSINREANFTHLKVGLLSIGNNFRDDLGFIRRPGIRKWSLDTGIRPRPPALRAIGIREMHPHVGWNYITDQSGEELAKRLHTGYSVFFNNGGFTELSWNPVTETLVEPFEIHPDVDPIPVGQYDWTEWMLRYNSDPSKPVTVELTGILGTLWNGTQQTIRATANVRPIYKFTTSLGLSRTHGTLTSAGNQEESFVRAIWTGRLNYSFTTNMYLDALVQYLADTGLLNVNIRFNFIHHALSNLYVVYNEQRFTTDELIAPGRSLIVKFTQMFGF